MTNTKYIDIKEFREEGFLQELNRVYLHPLGMALEVKIDEDGNESLGGIWDYRDDPEGMLYGGSVIMSEKAKKNADNVFTIYNEKSKYREENYGFTIQPLGENGVINQD